MSYREMQQAAQTLLALLEAAPAAGRNTENTPPGEDRMINDNINYVNQTNTPGDWDLMAAADAQAGEVSGLRTAERSPGTAWTEPAGAAASGRRALRSLSGGGEGPAGSFAAEGPDGADPEADLEAIDRFFRRDSRRYDGGFSEL